MKEYLDICLELTALTSIVCICIWHYAVKKIHKNMTPEQINASKEFFKAILPAITFIVAAFYIALITIIIKIHFKP